MKAKWMFLAAVFVAAIAMAVSFGSSPGWVGLAFAEVKAVRR